MKRISLLLSLLIAVGCSSSKYTINGVYTPKAGEENVSFYLVNYYTHDTLATIELKDNAFKYVGEFEEPFMLRIVSTDKKIRAGKTFIVEKGTIDVDLNNGNSAPNTPLNIERQNILKHCQEIARPYDMDSRKASDEIIKKALPNFDLKNTDPRNRPQIDHDSQLALAAIKTKFETEKNQAIEDYFSTIVPQYNNILGVEILLKMFHSGASGTNGGLKGFIRLYDLAGDYVKEFPDVKKISETQVPFYLGEVATAEGKMFTDFTIEKGNLDGTPAKLSDYVGKGKYILVDFWASWCKPCRMEIPFIKAAYEKYKGDNFDVLSIAVSDKREATAAAAEAEGVVWNQIVETEHNADKVYGVRAIPEIILFGPDGTILKRGLRGTNIDIVLSEVLNR